MAKVKEVYICTSCGYESAKWSGRCPGCSQWNTMEQTVKAPPTTARGGLTAIPICAKPQAVTEINCDDEIRYQTGLHELDRVLGGGLVKGSLVLLSGDPGIGKSTLILQICQQLGHSHKILYVSGEESARQIKLRADRLGVQSENLYIASCTDMDTVLTLVRDNAPDVVMIDSIQTMSCEGVSSSAGSITQVRECTTALMGLAKTQEIPVIVVGHVNKDGAIAGPKVLEHMVDAVLYFEGERQHAYRILRGVKNRFGSTNEIGVFEMRDNGLREVENPSMMLLSGRPEGVSGSCVVCVMEGTRPLLVEVQALVTKSPFAVPRRVCTGFDYNRMALLIAVLEKRAGYTFSALDAYVNVVGGFTLDEPAADLAVALALVSSLRDKPIAQKVLVFGEIGLGGEIRNVSSILPRIKEAQRLGFSHCIVPQQALSEVQNMDALTIAVTGVADIAQACHALAQI